MLQSFFEQCTTKRDKKHTLSHHQITNHLRLVENIQREQRIKQPNSSPMLSKLLLFGSGGVRLGRCIYNLIAFICLVKRSDRRFGHTRLPKSSVGVKKVTPKLPSSPFPTYHYCPTMVETTATKPHAARIVIQSTTTALPGMVDFGVFAFSRHGFWISFRFIRLAAATGSSYSSMFVVFFSSHRK